MDLFLHLLPLALVAASAVASVYLFVVLKSETQRFAARRVKVEADLSLELDNLKKRVEELAGEAARAPSPVSSTSTAGMNLATRSLALRRIRQGEGPERIAAALKLPRKEVELLIKVSRIDEKPLNASTA